jgi:2-dehydropantoate 2-reductase
MVSSLTGLSPSEWACDEQALETGMATCHEIMTELMVLARAMGYDESLIPSTAPDTLVAETRAKLQGTDFVPSALLDVRLKIPFELEVIMGWVYREAKARKIPTPVSTM